MQGIHIYNISVIESAQRRGGMKITLDEIINITYFDWS